jgi:TatD DNase family protein
MLFDTHCHLDVPAFDADREDVIARALAAGVSVLLNPAYDLASSRRAIALANVRRDVYAAVGIHPNDIAALEPGGLDELRRLALSPRVVAIGEIGLDYYWNTSPHDVQQAMFRRQIELAQELNLPIIIHCREAYEDTLAILETAGSKILLHSFAGSPEQADEAMRRGYCLGVGGPVTFKKSEALREIVRRAPLDHLFLETDAPYLAPHPYRGKRNEPAYLALSAQKVAEVRRTTVDEVAAATTGAARRFFNIS